MSSRGGRDEGVGIRSESGSLVMMDMVVMMEMVAMIMAAMVVILVTVIMVSIRFDQ